MYSPSSSTAGGSSTAGAAVSCCVAGQHCDTLLCTLTSIHPPVNGRCVQVKYTDGVKGDLSTAHPSIMPDGTLLNFTRSLPNGGFHVYKQDPNTLTRTEVGGWVGADCTEMGGWEEAGYKTGVQRAPVHHPRGLPCVQARP